MSWIQVTFYGLFCLNLQVYERRKDLLMANLAAPTWDKLPIKAINCCRVSAPMAYLSQKNKTKTLAKKNMVMDLKQRKVPNVWILECFVGRGPIDLRDHHGIHHSASLPSLLTPTNTTWKIKNHLLHINAVHFLSGLRKMDMPRWARQLIKCPWDSWTREVQGKGI